MACYTSNTPREITKCVRILPKANIYLLVIYSEWIPFDTSSCRPTVRRQYVWNNMWCLWCSVVKYWTTVIISVQIQLKWANYLPSVHPLQHWDLCACLIHRYTDTPCDLLYKWLHTFECKVNMYRFSGGTLGLWSCVCTVESCAISIGHGVHNSLGASWNPACCTFNVNENVL